MNVSLLILVITFLNCYIGYSLKSPKVSIRMNCYWKIHQKGDTSQILWFSYFHTVSRRQYMKSSLVVEEPLEHASSTSKSTNINQTIIPASQLASFRSGKLPIVFLKSAFPTDLIDRLRFDSKSLESFGNGIPSAGVAKGLDIAHTIRKDVHQVWLSSPGQILNVDSTPFVGDLDMRRTLFNTVEQLRRELVNGENYRRGSDDPVMTEEERLQLYYNSIWGAQAQDDQGVQSRMQSNTNEALLDGIDRLHPGYIELSYLSYSKGSFYRRHVDRFQTKSDIKRDSIRVVSFILYLGSDDDTSRYWDTNTDGGCLRVYGVENVKQLKSQGVAYHNPLDTIDTDLNTGEEYIDVAPLPGTLLLFDSCKVPHAVRETHRSRRCLVGWFGSLI